MSRKANTRHGAVVECPTHKRKRSFKPSAAKPTNNCVICHVCWLADKLECSLYESDVDNIIKFSNTFKSSMKANSIEYIETAKEG